MNLIMKLYKKMPVSFRKKWGGVVKNEIKKNAYRKAVNNYLKSYKIENPDIFTSVEIETLNRCNGQCHFCPVNVNEPQRKYAKMSKELYQKIISELSEMDFDGELALFSNNEPFLDERIIEFSKIAREKLTNAFIYIYTNGTLLSIQKVVNVMFYIDKLVIDNYDEESTELFDAIRLWATKNDKDIDIIPRKRDEVLTSRGGQAPNKSEIIGSKAKCFLPFSQLVIRPDGKVSLCCNDALGIYTMGDANVQSIYDIWNSNEYKKIRFAMKKSGRKNLLLCKNCDTENYTGIYKKERRKDN